MSKKILVVIGHPARSSLCHGLANSYTEGARAAGAKVELIALSELKFDLSLHEGYRTPQDFEPDLKKFQELILWSEHLVFVYPIWWGSVPAALKGLIDRAFTSGFAFKYHDHDPLWDKLLKGRSAQIITACDAPGWWIAWAYRNSDANMMKHAVLKFCGISPVSVTRFSGVRRSSSQQREAWLKKTHALGRAFK